MFGLWTASGPGRVGAEGLSTSTKSVAPSSGPKPWLRRGSSSFFFPFLLLIFPDVLNAGACGGGSSLGRISIKKSNWSDLAIARAMSDLDKVLRLFVSATMKARAVISAMNISQALQNIIGASAAIILTSGSLFITFLMRAKGNGG